MTAMQDLFGRVDRAELERIVVVSPHMDDAVLGASHVLGTYSGSTVVTVFAGKPESYPVEPTEWDASGGFRPGDDIVSMRRKEDSEALAVLEAQPKWMEYVDHQYVAEDLRAPASTVAEDLRSVLADLAPTAVFLPMGLANPDHVVTHDAGILVRGSLNDASSDTSWFCYEDAGYKHIPGIVAWRVAKLFRALLWPTPAVVPVVPDMALKQRAIERYKSQLPPLRADHALDERTDANVPEQYWRIAPPPPGWEALVEVQ